MILLNVFPELLFLSFFAPLLLRVVAGIVFISYTIRKRTCWSERFRDIVFLLGGILLVAGAWTQVAALVLVTFLIVGFFLKEKQVSLASRALLIAICLSLILTGAGVLAIDYPL